MDRRSQQNYRRCQKRAPSVRFYPLDNAVQIESIERFQSMSGKQLLQSNSRMMNSAIGESKATRRASIHATNPIDSLLGRMRRGYMRYINKRKAGAWSRSRGLQLPKDGITKHRLGTKLLHRRVIFNAGGVGCGILRRHSQVPGRPVEIEYGIDVKIPDRMAPNSRKFPAGRQCSDKSSPSGNFPTRFVHANFLCYFQFFGRQG